MNTIQITQTDYNRLQDLLTRHPASTAEEKACQQSLFRELTRARIVPPSQIASDVITLGSRARLIDLDSNDVLEFTLVLPEEADVAEGRLSILAPLGTAMLGFRRGDTFEWTMPGGKLRLKVDQVTPDESPQDV